MSYLKLKASFMFLLFVGMTLCLPLASPILAAEQPQEHVLMLSATTKESPPTIRLQWEAKPTPLGPGKVFTVWRKTKEATTWTSVTGTNGHYYEDKNVVVGQTYEYKVQCDSYVGYIWAGIKAPAVESRGKVVLLVESEQAAALGTELETLKKDLIGDGWTVLRHDVSRNATPQSARALVQADYNGDPANVKAVFLLGHIPVFKSGNIAPDGHADHVGSWPADAYYGSMTASWDSSPSVIPGDVQLQVGRADFDNMPAFSKNATELLRQYLNKDHTYRIGQMTTTKDFFVSNGFPTMTEYFAFNNAYRLAPAVFGAGARIDDGSWAQYLPGNTYTWGHINGPGSYTSVGAVGGSLTTSHLASAAAQNYGIIFNQTFGSYFGDWDRQNNLLRAFLALPDYGLTNAWTGRPHWFFHHMALGETIGYSTRLTQNNTGAIYTPTGAFARYIHIALMGDPTLRMFPVLPATNLQAASGTGGATTLQWTASADRAVTDYYVYGAATPEGPYTRLGIVKGTTWTHTSPGTTKHYMVRACKLTTTGSGSYYNLSQGVMAQTAASTNQFTVTYDYGENGGTSATVTSAQVNSGGAVSLTPTAAKANWDFVGWNTDKNATTALTSYTMPSNNVTLYAIYKRTLTATLKDYSGTTAATRTAAVTIYNKATGGAVTIPAANTYTGWTARGWSTATTANASPLVVSGSYTISGNITLYGLYQKSLTMTYNAAGGTPTPATQTLPAYTNSANITGISYTPLTLPAAITRTGYTFDGWVSSVSGSKFNASQTVTPGMNTTFTAAWKTTATPFTVTYNYGENGGTSATVTSAQVNSGGAVSLTPTAAKTNWDFVGWNTNKDATTALTSYTMPSNNVTLYAIYKRTLTATLKDYNGTTAATRTAAVTIYNKATGGTVTIPAANIYTGWTARGWSTAATANASPAIVSGSYTISANVTLYGLYQRTLTVSYNANGGTPTPANQTGTAYVNSYAISTYASAAITLPGAITRRGYTFDSWTSNISGMKHKAGEVVWLGTNTTFTAVWK
ncbi:MAG: InlB B-repeat-containing protein [Peptococcaceae bacterium]|nr:InlB B-repeat-containing protein [Peptococcaceae bacterium]